MIDYLTKHIYNRSISEALLKILSEVADNENTKKTFVFNIIDQIEKEDYEGKLNSAYVLSEMLNYKSFSEIFKTEEINKRLFQLLASEDDLSVR